MATRLIGTDSANPRLPQGVITASQGESEFDLAPGDTLAEANAYTNTQIAEVVAGGVQFADNAETIAGTLVDQAVTPAGLAYERPYFDVRTYGAVGDGTTDDTTAIQATIDACSAAGGGIVWFPRGTYIISATLTVPSFVALVGVGGPYRTSEWGIDPPNVSSNIDHVSASAFTMIRNADSTNGNSSIEIRGLRLTQEGETGDNFIIDFNKTRRSLIRDCYLRGAATTSRIGFRYRGASEHNLIETTMFEGCGIKSDGSANKLTVRACEIGVGGIQITGGFDHMIADCDIYNNGVSGTFAPYPNIIYLSSTIGAIVKNNMLAASLQHGLLIASCRRSVVTGNTVKDCSRQTGNTWSGIALDTINATNCEFNVVANNVCWDTNGVTGTQRHGVTITNTVGSTSNNVVTGNMLLGNRTSPLNQVAAASNVVDAADLNTFEFREHADSAAPLADRALLYAKDNGAAKTQLVARFPTGAVQVIATEP